MAVLEPSGKGRMAELSFHMGRIFLLFGKDHMVEFFWHKGHMVQQPRFHKDHTS